MEHEYSNLYALAPDISLYALAQDFKAVVVSNMGSDEDEDSDDNGSFTIATSSPNVVSDFHVASLSFPRKIAATIIITARV